MEAKSNQVLEILLRKYLEGKSSSREKRELFDLIARSDNEFPVKEILLNNLNKFDDNQFNSDTIDFDFIYGNILNGIKKTDNGKERRMRPVRRSKVGKMVLTGLSIAAVAVFTFYLGTLFTKSIKKDSSEFISAINYCEIKSPLGSKSEITLPDGSQVMLNAGSILKYKSDFNLNNRDLYLVGEAYFKVAKNTGLPLYVNAGSISIKAVGTEFNVKAYNEGSIIETTLVEGKVEITQSGQNKNDNQYLNLDPDQKAIYVKDLESFVIEKTNEIDSMAQPSKTIYNNILISPKVDVDQVVAWTYGKLILRGESLDNLCIELQRKYDVNIIFKDEEIKMYRFSGVLLDETLEQVMNVIKLTAPIEYSLEGKTVYLSSDKKQKNNYLQHLK